MTDWSQYLACAGCHALMGQACYALSSGGPQALPPQYLDAPHRNRKLSTAKTGVAAGQKALRSAKSTEGPHRRRTAKAASAADAWRALADRRRG